ncbi:hypothetical protein NDU88_001224 [Pleurodeles waltl]|uniref:Uncharacterized protein n=1 Tax=Pleurodeles waltl TaxID=8319 RepID=A0AAV7M2H9_PLEWA|nr:hypothetical protein NDU88_001224 [Pleurodeles waltl]
MPMRSEVHWDDNRRVGTLALRTLRAPCTLELGQPHLTEVPSFQGDYISRLPWERYNATQLPGCVILAHLTVSPHLRDMSQQGWCNYTLGALWRAAVPVTCHLRVPDRVLTPETRVEAALIHILPEMPYTFP